MKFFCNKKKPPDRPD